MWVIRGFHQGIRLGHDKSLGSKIKSHNNLVLHITNKKNNISSTCKCWRCFGSSCTHFYREQCHCRVVLFHQPEKYFHCSELYPGLRSLFCRVQLPFSRTISSELFPSQFSRRDKQMTPQPWSPGLCWRWMLASEQKPQTLVDNISQPSLSSPPSDPELELLSSRNQPENKYSNIFRYLEKKVWFKCKSSLVWFCKGNMR